tara:strand:- start:119 stop:448 length:330 start_codon:yes stop_codon:yes gene_type:complete
MKWLSQNILKKSLKCLVVLNLYDAICTFVWVTSGLAEEANPLMATLLDLSPLYFMLVKMTLVNFGIWLIWQNQQHVFAKFATIPAFVLYALVALKHTVYIAMYMLNLIS